MRIKIVVLIEYYCLKADECTNKYSNKECHEFLRELKIRAEEVSPWINIKCFFTCKVGEITHCGNLLILPANA